MSAAISVIVMMSARISAKMSAARMTSNISVKISERMRSCENNECENDYEDDCMWRSEGR